MVRLEPKIERETSPEYAFVLCNARGFVLGADHTFLVVITRATYSMLFA